MFKIFSFVLAVILIFLGIYIFLFSSFFLVEPVSLQNRKEIGIKDSFEIDFPYSVNEEYYKKKIVLDPRTNMKAVINTDRNKIVLTPSPVWKEGMEYKVIIPSGRTSFYMPIKEKVFIFKIENGPKVISSNPVEGAKNVIIGAENPFIFNFDKEIKNFFIDFSISPKVKLTYRQSEDKKSFEILPVENLKEGTEYVVNVRSKPRDVSDDFYQDIYQVKFTTFLTPKPKTWQDTLNERLDFAKNNTQPKITDGKYIDIDLRTQVMVTFENGQNVGTYLISSGKSGMNTPRGTWYILNKNPRKWSNKYKLYMPYWMAITKQGHGIHELPEWPNGYKEGQNHLGIAVSHGCVRLGVGNAEKVYGWAEVGTPVVVH